ncbi:hypothetical protein Peur_030567 [Populus x canadensis]
MLLHFKGLHRNDFFTCLMKLPVTRGSLTADGFEKTNIQTFASSRLQFCFERRCPGLKAICAFDTGSVLLQNQEGLIA